MKNLLPKLLTLLLCLTASIPIYSANGDTFTYNGINYKVLDVAFRTLEVTENKSFVGNAEIPETIDRGGWGYVEKYTVVSIDYKAFEDCTGLTSVTIPKSVTSIGSYAFHGCTNLTDITVSSDNKNYKSLDGVLFSYKMTSLFIYPAGKTGDYIIPNSVKEIGGSPTNYHPFSGCTGLTSVTIPNSVTTIGYRAFEGCTDLTSVTIPNSVTSIKSDAFIGCTNLTNINVSEGNSEFKSLDGVVFNNDLTQLLICPNGKTGSYVIPNSVTTIGDYALEGCTGLTSVTVPESVTTIGYSAFKGCTSLTSVTIPKSVTLIWDKAFSNCTALTSLDVPASVTLILEKVFYGCSSLTSVTIPESVTSIGKDAFSGCAALTSLIIPTKLSLSSEIFNGCTLKPLIFQNGFDLYSESNNPFVGLNEESVIMVPSEYVSKTKKLFNGTVKIYNPPFVLTDLNPYLQGVKFKIADNPDYADAKAKVTKVEIKGPLITDGTMTVTPDSEGVYAIKGLKCNEEYTVRISYTCDGSTNELFKTETFRTLTPNVNVYTYTGSMSSTQTTVTLNKNAISASSDWSASPNKYILIMNQSWHDVTNGTCTVKNLNPDTYYELRAVAYYDHDYIVFSSNQTTIATKEAIKNITVSNPTPTVAMLSSGCINGDLAVKECWFTVGSQKYGVEKAENVSVTLTGLLPNSKYVANFTAKTDKGAEFTKTAEFTTPSLTLKMLAPKGVSSTCAIVAAETNIADVEPNVGFQWKKIDAPASLAPKEGYAAIYDGRLEGYIQNLQPTYYNVRAFYKSSNGSYIYSDWVTFDPTDFSFFEPTVHTYEVISVSHDSAMLKGYVLAGTDAIKSQGFQYWMTDANQQGKISTVTATSAQVMTANIKGLKANTSYTYRAFVETDAGYKYGEEQTFSTTDGGGLAWDDIEIDSADGNVEIVGIYDFAGQRHDELRQGLNIVLYSDGTSKKIYVNE